MRPMQFAAGATVFRAGDPSTAVYVIKDGAIAIRVGEGEVARLGAGELFGESGVLEARPRSASAVATAPTTLLVTDATQFIGAFGMGNDNALALIKLLCRRLRATSARVAAVDAADFHPVAVRLIPDHARLLHEFGVTATDIRHLPFQVGNRYGGEAAPVGSNQTCCIPARAEPNLSAPHFEIMRRAGQLGVRDLFSRLGTIVNGLAISRGTQDGFALLHGGENIVIAGRRDSVFRFRVVVADNA